MQVDDGPVDIYSRSCFLFLKGQRWPNLWRAFKGPPSSLAKHSVKHDKSLKVQQLACFI